MGVMAEVMGVRSSNLEICFLGADEQRFVPIPKISESLTNLMLAMIIRHLNVQIKCFERIIPLNDVIIRHLNVQNEKFFN